MLRHRTFRSKQEKGNCPPWTACMEIIMSKYAKFTLLTLAAFLVLGFSITVNAAPPWLEDNKPQMMKSAPLSGTSFYCHGTNQTDSTISVTWEFVEKNGDSVPLTGPIDPGNTSTLQWGPGSKIVHCVISWEGQPSDFRASFCAFGGATNYTQPAICLELF